MIERLSRFIECIGYVGQVCVDFMNTLLHHLQSTLNKSAVDRFFDKSSSIYHHYDLFVYCHFKTRGQSVACLVGLTK